MKQYKKCKKCGETKPVSEFIKGYGKSGVGASCKACERIRGRSKRRRNYESAKSAQLKRKYGITGEVYDFLLKGQDYVCRICHKTPEENGQALTVDHCHETGNVRGLLCKKCNTGLGMFEDSEIYVQAALDYLRSSKK